MDEQAQLTQCLDDGTVDLIFMTTIIPVLLSVETSDCVMAALDIIDPRAVMTAGLEGAPQTAMAGSMAAFTVSEACLNDEEWATAAPRLGMGPEDRDGMVCIMAALGGPAEMATAMTEAMAAEEVGEDTALFTAGLECGMEPGPEPSTTPEPATASPTPMPTPTTVAPTPVSTASTPAPTTAPEPTTTASTSAPTETTTPPTPAPSETKTLVITVADIPEGIPEYDRDDWKHWVDADGDCQNAGQEVLIAESMEPVEYEDDRQCRVESGRWWAPHLGHHLENPQHIDVDHHVPLKNAHPSGGWGWDAAKKETYANYLEDPDHLVAISSRHNRSKGARGPEEWAPPDNDLWCDYASNWAEIKESWGLTMTPVESEIVMTCWGPANTRRTLRWRRGKKWWSRSGYTSRQRSQRTRFTGPARKQKKPERRECRAARAEARDSRRRWCRAPETVTESSVRDKQLSPPDLRPIYRQAVESSTKHQSQVEYDVHGDRSSEPLDEHYLMTLGACESAARQR